MTPDRKIGPQSSDRINTPETSEHQIWRDLAHALAEWGQNEVERELTGLKGAGHLITAEVVFPHASPIVAIGIPVAHEGNLANSDKLRIPPRKGSFAPHRVFSVDSDAGIIKSKTARQNSFQYTSQRTAEELVSAVRQALNGPGRLQIRYELSRGNWRNLEGEALPAPISAWVEERKATMPLFKALAYEAMLTGLCQETAILERQGDQFLLTIGENRVSMPLPQRDPKEPDLLTFFPPLEGMRITFFEVTPKAPELFAVDWSLEGEDGWRVRLAPKAWGGAVLDVIKGDDDILRVFTLPAQNNHYAQIPMLKSIGRPSQNYRIGLGKITSHLPEKAVLTTEGSQGIREVVYEAPRIMGDQVLRVTLPDGPHIGHFLMEALFSPQQLMARVRLE